MVDKLLYHYFHHINNEVTCKLTYYYLRPINNAVCYM